MPRISTEKLTTIALGCFDLTAERKCYQRVVVGKRLGDEDVVELPHEDPFAVEARQVGHWELLQVVRPETVEGHEQERHAALTHAVPRGHAGSQESQQQPDASQEDEQDLQEHAGTTNREKQPLSSAPNVQIMTEHNRKAEVMSSITVIGE